MKDIEIDLSRTEHYLINLFSISESIGIDRLEVCSLREILDWGYGTRVLQTNLGAGQNKWLAIVPQHLSSQKVEIVGGHGDLSKLEVYIGAIEVIIKSIYCVIGLRVYILEESFDMAS